MKRYFAYIRVSTVKQGEHGASLHEQRDAITSFATRHGFTITEWFEERETAAKVGRREFTRMLGLLKKRQAEGVLFHKIDRGARNLKDWSVIQDLTEREIDVQFAHESVDLTSNAGRLTGDFLAVIASHYIRNLRDEVKKGLRGRLKQGIFPFAAPIGYLDQGGGKLKIPDPERAPLVRLAFELYSTGRYTLKTVAAELRLRGLRSRRGSCFGVNHVDRMLRNSFYAGLITIKRHGETYPGNHEPLISMRLFQAVQRALDRKANAKVVRHDFLFRRMVHCESCGRSLIGERQKGHVYYRCHTRECPVTGLREEVVDQAVRQRFAPFVFTEVEVSDMRALLQEMEGQSEEATAEQDRVSALQLEGVRARLSRLVDAYLDSVMDKATFEAKKRELLIEERFLEDAVAERKSGTTAADNMEKLELLLTLSLSYSSGGPDEKREMLRKTTSNLSVLGKNVGVALKSPYQQAANWANSTSGAPLRDRPRTRKMLRTFVEFMLSYDISDEKSSNDGESRRRDSESAAT